jgi:hypothetical protein
MSFCASASDISCMSNYQQQAEYKRAEKAVKQAAARAKAAADDLKHAEAKLDKARKAMNASSENE